eukprot:CAMPEP_0171858444 /NCGR_PEP_ID=MMETSP0992-20121227/25300_1 /TAXON_ID=483369 /ORGANISM="non described non described, Strain CCMP2098" /LENGTH=107 /DNA_ID=CAMNT_0012479895 /DNA_START=235 /DNA_END=555 /DNA_ORIENTATION=+
MRPVVVPLPVRVVVAPHGVHVGDAPDLLQQRAPLRAFGREVHLAPDPAVDVGGPVPVHCLRLAHFDGHAHRGARSGVPGSRGRRRRHVRGARRGDAGWDGGGFRGGE